MHTYISTYTSHFAPFLESFGTILFNSNIFNQNTGLSNNQHSLQSLDFFLLTESLFLYFSNLSLFCRILSPPLFVLTKTIHLLPHLFPHLSLFPRYFSFLVLFFFNGVCSFSQLILPLTLQIIWKLCGMNFFNLLILHLQNYCHLNILLQLPLVSGRDVSFF